MFLSLWPLMLKLYVPSKSAMGTKLCSEAMPVVCCCNATPSPGRDMSTYVTWVGSSNAKLNVGRVAEV